MAIPDYQSCMLPMLAILGDRAEHRLRDVEEELAKEFQLSEAERAELLPSGRQPVFRNRIGWARTYLKKAGLIESSKRGLHAITQRGIDCLNERPARIDVRYLSRFPEFMAFKVASRSSDPAREDTASAVNADATPEEQMEAAHQGLQRQLAEELLQRIAGCSPAFFEQLVVQLLVAMGYGGSLNDAGQRIGRSGDGGIDGIIKEDRLGLDVIYLQAKRWQGTVGRPEIQKFVGALQGQRARKGVFITTSSYTSEARDYAERIDTKLVLIDGETLANLMIDFNVGVAAAATFVVKKIDSDYFEEA